MKELAPTAEHHLPSLSTGSEHHTEVTPDSLMDAHDNREASPFGGKILRVAMRINRLLEKRAASKVQLEATAENEKRDIDNFGYTTDTQIEALEMNEAFDAKAARKAERAQKIEDAKERVRGFGRSALSRLKNAGELTLGLGLIAGEATSQKAADLKTAAGEKIQNAASQAMNTAERLSSQTGQALENGVAAATAKVAGAKEIVSDYLTIRREKAAVRKEQALTRKYERHALWRNRKTAAIDHAQEFKASQVEKSRRLRIRGHIARAALGSSWAAARETYRETRDSLKLDQ